MLGIVVHNAEPDPVPEGLRTLPYRTLAETTSDWIWETDAENRFTYSSGKAREVLGYEPEELIARTPLELVVPEERDAAAEKMAAMASTLLPVSGFEVTCFGKDGRRVVLEISGVPRLDEQRAFAGVRAIARDVTERKRAEEIIRRSEEKYRSLVSNIPDVVWTLDDGLRFAFISSNIEKISGFSLEEIQRQGGDLYLDCIHPDDVDRVGVALRALFATGEKYDVECRIARKDGEWIWVHDRALATYEKDGVRYADGLLSDITARKRAELALQRSEAQLKEALQAAQMGVWTWTQATDAITWDENFYRIAGRDPKLPPPHFRELSQCYTPESWKRMMPTVEQTLATGTPYELDLEVVRPDGSRRWTIARGQPLRDDDGHIVGLRGTAQDITERKHAEQAVAESEKRYRLLFERNLAGVFRVSPDGRYLDCNDTCARTLGYPSREEFLQHPAADMFFNPADLHTAVSRILKEKSLTNLELHLKRKDGGSAYVLENVNLVENEGGEPSVIEGTFIDITKRKLAEEAAQEAAARFKAIFDSVQTGIVIIDPETHRIVDANPEALRLAGSTRETVVGAECFQFICPAERGRCPVTDLGQNVDSSERVMLNASGQPCPIIKTVVPMLISGRRHLLESFVDISDRKRGEQLLRQSEEKYRSLISNIPDVVWTVDDNRRLVFVSPNVEKVSGFTAEEVHQAGGVSLFLDRLHPDDARKVTEAFKALLADGAPFDIECRMLRKDGEWIWVHDRSTAPYMKDGIRYTDGVLSDITRRKKAEQQIAQMAHYDALTGLANRALFVDSLELEIARTRRSDTTFAVLYLDLDHFKDVNDTLGHPVGDRLLQAVAERLAANVRETDTVARFGGDEFAIILTGIQDPVNAAGVADRLLKAVSSQYCAAAAGQVADKILKAFSESFLIQDNEIHSAASVGIAVYGPDSTDAETILTHADVALYRAKSEGRGTYRFFTDAMDVDVRSRVSLNKDLRDAIFSDRLFLVYQPQVDIASHSIVGLEALVRWHHPVQGYVSPAKFIPEAEKSGLIIPLQRWVLREACRQIKQWLDEGIALPSVAVNLSGVQFKMPLELENDVSSALACFGLPPRLLELELTESVLMTAASQHNELLVRLRERGHRIAIDDFGSGYSSLEYLRRYCADRIKIAQSFTADIGNIAGNDAIVRAALGLARELGMETVVEGVETAAQLELLKTWGCRIVQGYYFSRPLPVPDVTALLRIGKIDLAPAAPAEIPAPE